MNNFNFIIANRANQLLNSTPLRAVDGNPYINRIRDVARKLESEYGITQEEAFMYALKRFKDM